MAKLFILFFAASLAVGCNNKQKNEEIKEDVKDRLERVEESVDKGLDKAKEKLKEVRDTMKSRIHRATAPDSLK